MTYEQYNETNRGKQQLDNEGFCSGIHKVKKNTGLQIKKKYLADNNLYIKNNNKIKLFTNFNKQIGDPP